MIAIPLSGKNGEGKSAIVDDEDYEKIYKIKWFYVKGYAMSRDGISMHRLIMSPPSDMEIDHKNHDRLDNRKNNLKICTRKENARNVPHKGYHYDKHHGYWIVRRYGKSRIFHTEDDAKKASRLWDSGVEPESKRHGNSKYRPKYISRNRLSSYMFECTREGVRYTKYGFKTIKEAVEYRDAFFAKRGEKI